ncbi:hypothetical protein [Actinokineospora iranica]|uniref:Uncharacterized protein n=1 Tax=Actinokineospora iranica TaxID=1271860 RepID=A0A1G6LLL4_9PSEU|nr:hypothetical protein [Actinokineospora iranica]SDC43947.1 hypothetical protein SAMN05216174_102129 [Actinokineospora iranica]
MVGTGFRGTSDDDPRPGDHARRKDRFSDDLIGLDPADPEVREFAEHLDRVERVRPSYTVEGYLGQVSDFADSANRLGGHYRLTAGIVAALILLGVVVAAWDALVFIVSVLLG